MPKQKYYAIVNESGDLINLPGDYNLPIYDSLLAADEELANWWKHQFKVVPIPADSLHKLIKEHTKKAK